MDEDAGDYCNAADGDDDDNEAADAGGYEHDDNDYSMDAGNGGDDTCAGGGAVWTAGVPPVTAGAGDGDDDDSDKDEDEATDDYCHAAGGHDGGAKAAEDGDCGYDDDDHSVDGGDAGEDERAGSSPARTADAPLTFGAADHEPDEAHPTIDVCGPDGHWHTAHLYRRKDHPASVVMWLGVVWCGTYTFVGGALTDADGGSWRGDSRPRALAWLPPGPTTARA
jgi:hypothetical protein